MSEWRRCLWGIFLLGAVGVENSFMLEDVSIVVFPVNVKWELTECVNLSVLCYFICIAPGPCTQLWIPQAQRSSCSEKHSRHRAAGSPGEGCPALIAQGAALPVMTPGTEACHSTQHFHWGYLDAGQTHTPKSLLLALASIAVSLWDKLNTWIFLVDLKIICHELARCLAPC